MTAFNATLSDDTLVIENSRIARRCRWNSGHLVSLDVTNKTTGQTITLAGQSPDFMLPGSDVAPNNGKMTVTEVQATAIAPAHGRVEVTVRLGDLEVRRVFRIYADCPAMACDYYLRGRAPEGLHEATIERIAWPRPHLRLTCVRFYDMTDRRNNLTSVQTVLPYPRFENRLAGNLILIQDPFHDAGLFVLKEAPCSDAQLAWPGYDVIYKMGDITMVGPGVTPADLSAEQWTRCYGFVTGIAGAGEYSLLSALHAYQSQVRRRIAQRDEMILVNTWGDRGQDARLGEAFAMAEVEAASRLGASHFQLDDGWQAGRTTNSAFAGGTLTGIWEREGFWSVHPQRFPRGLAPVVQRAHERGVQVGLWFNPSKDHSYANWQNDANTLIDLHKKYGIRTFKIDGVDVLDKRGETNLRAMFDTVLQASNGDVVFNLDITAGHRFGYHYFNEYGNLFLENRYTDVPNYYPHWTLRNLWMLSRYVPAQNLQMEFLNKWRNTAKYPADDPLAPAHVPFDYCFAVTMIGQPLAWFEASNLPEEAFVAAPIIHAYRQRQERIHSGHILPIGAEPSGTAWTGFQSILDESSGYLLVLRELNERPSAAMRLWGLAGRTIACTHVLGRGADYRGQISDDGALVFSLPQPFSFALYEYEAR